VNWKALQFTWYDSFQPKKATSQTDLEFERANIVYNLAALESLAGMQQDRSTIEGMKLAIASFQKAAGLFQSLEQSKDEEARRIKGPLTADLSPEALIMLRTLMLAQAQVCYFEKATKDNLKPTVLSKLACQAGLFFEQALTQARLPILAGILDKAWALHFEFHRREYEAWAEFHASRAMKIQADETSVGYGDEIIRLRKAGVAVRAACDFASKNKLPVGLLQAMQQLMKRIQVEEARAMDENNKIYMSSIPDSVPALEGHALAKPIVPDDVKLRKLLPGSPEETQDTIFRGLLIPWVREAETMLHSRLSAIVQTYGGKVQGRSDEIRQRLAEAGLPAAVESGSGEGAGVPDGTWERIVNTVFNRGGFPGLMADANDNKIAATALSDSVADIDRALNEEEAKDLDARNNGRAGESKPSSMLNSTMRSDVRKLSALLVQAAKSDAAVLARIEAAQPFLNLISISREELAQLLPNAREAVESDPRLEPVRTDLGLALVNLGVQVQECEAAQGKLMDETSSATIVAEAISKGESHTDAVVNKAISAFNPLLRSIDDKLSRTGALFMAVLEKNHEFAALRTQNEATRLREAKINDIETAVNKFNELLNNVNEGARFYADFTTRVEQLRIVVNDFCFVRDVERAEVSKPPPPPQEASMPIAMAYSNYDSVVPGQVVVDAPVVLTGDAFVFLQICYPFFCLPDIYVANFWLLFFITTGSSFNK